MKTFLVLWSSQAVSLFGSALVEFALAWHLTKETGSATILATAMLVALLPQVILGPLIGPFIDRWDRKKIMIIADTSVALLTTGLVVLFFTGAIEVWHIYVAMAGRAIGQAIHFPAMQASIPMIVPEKHLARAAGLNQSLQGMVTVLGPPAGALLLGLVPMQGVLAIDIVTAAIAVSCLLFISIPRPQRTAQGITASPIRDMVEGFRYVWQSPGMPVLIGLSMFIAFLFIPVFTLMPVLVQDHLGGDVLKLGWLNSAFGVGIIVGGVMMGVWGGFKRRIITCLMGIVLASIATFAFGFTSESLFSFVLLASLLVGVGLAFGNAPIMAILQSVVPKDMQGRLFALFGSLTSAITPIGLAIAGPAADNIGIRPLYFIAGASALFILVLSLFSKSLMNLGSAAPTKLDVRTT